MVIASSPWWHSFYVSVGLGSELLQAKESSSANFNTATAVAQSPISNQQTANQQGNSVLGHFGIGFALAKGAYYLGIEPYLEVSELSGNSRGNLVPSLPSITAPPVATSNQTMLRLSTLSGGFDFKPGLLITPQLTVFGIIGGNIRRVKVTSSSALIDPTGVFANAPNVDVTSSTSRTEFAARFGFGLQSWINHHWAMTLNFIHNFYPNQSTQASTNTTALGSQISNSTASNITDLSSNILMIGANYYFSPLSPSSAWLSAPTNVQWQGFFAGIATGAVINQALEDSRTTSNLTNNISIADSELDTGNVGSETTFFVGFGHPLHQHFYIGIRGFASWANRDIEGKSIKSSLSTTVVAPATLVTMSHNAEVSLRNIEWGADLLPGFLITPQTLIHLTVGFAGNKATLASSTVLTGAVAGSAGTLASQGTTSKSLYGLRLGVGFQQAITNKVRMTADYVYTDYGTIEINDSSANAGAFFLRNASKFDLHSQAVLIGILVQV